MCIRDRPRIIHTQIATMSALDLITQYTQIALSHLPEPTQHLLRNPTAQKAFGVLAALTILRATNRFFSKRTLQNWTSNQPWISARELILLTGGCSGIGKQVMEDLARTGVRVVILDINEPNFTLPANVTFYKANVTSSADIAQVASKIRDSHGEPTVLINNAGVGYDGTILDEPEEKIRQTFEVNTLSLSLIHI